MVVISHFKLYPALFPLKWLICIPNISAVRGNVVFETLHDFYRTAIILYKTKESLKGIIIAKCKNQAIGAEKAPSWEKICFQLLLSGKLV